ncbi:MAG TPA: hypothetical protein VIQ27_18855 [Gemmatimonadales bacterium]
MRTRIVFGAGLAIGYILGTRAGRERYEQIKRSAQRVADNPKVQETAGLLGAQVSRMASAAKGRIGDRFAEKMPFVHKEEDHRRPTPYPERVPTGSGWPNGGS